MEIKAATHSDINAVLAQMRQLRAQAQQGIGPARNVADVAAPAGTPEPSRADFGGMLKSAIDSVNQLQKTASASSTAFVRGEETNLVKVMVDSQKSSVGFQAVVQVRNRMVTAYQDIMNMPI